MNKQEITPSNYSQIINSKPYVLILWDAPWNGHKDLSEQFTGIAEKCTDSNFAFGEIDVQAYPDLATQIGLLSIPAITYYIKGSPIKTVIRAQNIEEQVRWLLNEYEGEEYII